MGALHVPLKASHYLRRQVEVTPYPTEPVGWIIQNAGVETVLFSTDYPHPEGGCDPIARFEATLHSIGEEAKKQSTIAISR